MGVLADATGVAESLAPSDAGDGGRGKVFRHQGRTLFDVQFQVGADARWIKEAAPLPDGLRVEAAFDQGCFETSAVVRSRNAKTRRVEQSECAAAAEIRNVEPGGLFGANTYDGDIAVNLHRGPPQCGQNAEARDHPCRAVVVAALRNAVEMRADHDARRGAITPGERHHQVANGVDRHFKIHRNGRRPYDVMRRLFAHPITIAHDTPAAARRPIETIE